MSQDRLFSSVLFLFFLSFTYRKELLGRIVYISTLSCGFCMALYVIADYLRIDNIFFIALQPLRSFSILNLFLFLLFAKWISDNRTDLPPLELRVMISCIFFILSFCVSIELSLQMVLVASFWRNFQHLLNNRLLQGGILTILLVEGCAEIFPLYYLMGFSFESFHLIFIFFAAAIVIFFRKQMLVHVLLATISMLILQFNLHIRQKHALKTAAYKTEIINSLKQNIPQNATVVYLPGSIAETDTYLDLSPLRYSRKHIRVFVALADKAPACFSAEYAREYLLRKNRSEYYGVFVQDSIRLHSFLKDEKIEYVLSTARRPLRLIDSHTDVKLYAAD